MSMIHCSKRVVSINQVLIIVASIFLSYHDTIARPTRINMNPKTFLNTPFGSLAHVRFLISFCQKIAIAKSIAARPSVYEIKAKKPNANHAGSTIASISV